jgi:membrane fusion protein (multidrug efflux system)
MKHLSPVLLLLCIAIFSCKSKKEDPKKNQAPQITVVDVIVVTPQNIANTIEANGSVVAGESVEIRPEISGRIVYLNIAEGSHVARGTVIARVNDADLRAQQNKIRVQLELAQTTVERYKKLLDIQGINKADYDIALNQVNSFKADIDILNAEIAKTVVRAPFSGIMGLRMISNGAYVTPQNVLTTMQQVERVKIDFTLPESYAGLVKKGAQVVVETDRAGGTRRRATILAVESQISTSTRNVLVRAALEGPGISPGSFVKVYLEAGEASGILIPANAIIPDAMAKQVVVVKGGKAVFTSIQTGIRKEGSVEVTSGLKGGDSVVISGVLFARPNAPLKVRSVKQLAEVIK